MQKRVFVSLVCLGLVIAVAASVGADEDSWELSGIEKVRLKGVSGDVVIVPAEGKPEMIELRSDVDPEDAFHVVVDRDGKTLNIKEKWHGSSSGSVVWTLFFHGEREAPSIRISNASGNLVCRDVAVGIDYQTASGNIELNRVRLAEDSEFNTASGDYELNDMTVSEDTRFNTASGDFRLKDLIIEEGCSFNSASGNLTIEDCKSEGDVCFSSASGDVTVSNSALLGECSFSSASGDVRVDLDGLPKSDLSASSASGKVTLEVGDFGEDFTLILIKRKDKGRISCPFEYTAEEEFEDHHTYVKKIVRRGSGKPEIRLETASGKVVIKD